MKAELNEITVNGTVYVPKGTQNSMTPTVDGLRHVVIRTYSAGVHAGYLAKKEGSEVTLYNSRRIWKWKGANELCGLSTIGILYPNESCISPAVPEITLLGVIEIIPTTEKAAKTIIEAKEWIAK